jgi:hypothetical protein
MLRVLRDSVRATEMRERGFARAAMFRWDDSAAKMTELLAAAARR